MAADLATDRARIRKAIGPWGAWSFGFAYAPAAAMREAARVLGRLEAKVAAIENRIVVVGLAKDGPAQKADLRTGDVLLSISGSPVEDLAGLYRKVWSLGASGVEVPFSIYRDGKTFDARVKSGDRARFLKAPKMH